MPTKRKFPVRRRGNTEFRRYVRKRCGVHPDATMSVIRCFADWVHDNLVRGEMVYVAGVGTFSTYIRRLPARHIKMAHFEGDIKESLAVTVHLQCARKLKNRIKKTIADREKKQPQP